MVIDIAQLKINQKVHYVPFPEADSSTYENGMIKRIPDDNDFDVVWVVYHCNGDWANLHNYTGQLTNISQLRLGWHFDTIEITDDI